MIKIDFKNDNNKFFFLFVIIVFLIAFFIPVKYACVPYEREYNVSDSYEPVTRSNIENFRQNIPTYIYVVGDSMEPTFQGNSVCFCDVKEEDYIIDDVIVFEYNNRLIAHRIIHKEDNIFVTKGDNNIYPDPSITIENIICEIPVISLYEYAKMQIGIQLIQ